MFDCEADWFSTTLLLGQQVDGKGKKNVCALVVLFKLALYVIQIKVLVES